MLTLSKPVMLGISVGLIGAAILAFWWFYQIGKMYGRGDTADGEKHLLYIMGYCAVCGAIDAVMHAYVPLFWIVIASFALWKRFRPQKTETGA